MVRKTCLSTRMLHLVTKPLKAPLSTTITSSPDHSLSVSAQCDLNSIGQADVTSLFTQSRRSHHPLPSQVSHPFRITCVSVFLSTNSPPWRTPTVRASTMSLSVPPFHQLRPFSCTRRDVIFQPLLHLDCILLATFVAPRRSVWDVFLLAALTPTASPQPAVALIIISSACSCIHRPYRRVSRYTGRDPSVIAIMYMITSDLPF